MKIRTDYVSNSSSSSFVIWGVQLPQSTVEKTGNSWYDLLEWNAQLKICSCGGDVLIGLPPSDMKDDETLAEFKLRIVEQIKTEIPELTSEKDLLEAPVDYFQGISYDGDFVDE